MLFTALHRAIGFPPGPVDDDLLDAAVAARTTETDDLDWKAELPAPKSLAQSDFPKDVAAMANSGGGLIVYGVREQQKAATERVDVGELVETHERSMRSTAITAISPPLFGLAVHRLERNGCHAVVIEVPAAVDGPHLIYRNEYFGAPIRNNADTVWMRERQIEIMYRARFEARRQAGDSLDALYAEMVTGLSSANRAWLIGVARPRIPSFRGRMSRQQARDLLFESEHLTLKFSSSNGIHPLRYINQANPRPGLRRWVGASSVDVGRFPWMESWVNILDDGSVALATAAGGHPMRGFDGEEAGGHCVASQMIESSVSDLMALVRAAAQANTYREYDVKVGLVWNGSTEPLRILGEDRFGNASVDASTPLHSFVPVGFSVDACGPPEAFHEQVRELAQDCVNQGGVSQLRLINFAYEGTPSPF